MKRNKAQNVVQFLFRLCMKTGFHTNGVLMLQANRVLKSY